ncbi:DUF1207 domain-containing protein [Thalassoroseus pseudoceratinae]|uniref:DUF1207 domain-containing protein n=1 Tax=Thalassoroseus pseudoceratinae TaxID=2713176 RepID=UPI00141E5AD5|nr:DUF1207 domain-containing protein [Thalassoroseus pseudoceratinae]
MIGLNLAIHWSPVVAQELTEPAAIVTNADASVDESATPGVVSAEYHLALEQPSQWELLPDSLLYRSYLGNPRAPRLAARTLQHDGYDKVLELTAGARVGLLRYGRPGNDNPEGWQLDIEAAIFPRLNSEFEQDLDATDYRVGIPLTYREGPWQLKAGWYHLSAHVGEEFLFRNPDYIFREYFRDAVFLGVGFFPEPDSRVYAEAEYGFHHMGGSEPWHFQFGYDYSPVRPSRGFLPDPFFAINGTIMEEVDFSGGVNIVTGVQWRSDGPGRLFRIGLQYYNGNSLQYSFIEEHEEAFGFGVWYDF